MVIQDSNSPHPFFELGHDISTKTNPTLEAS